jgi:hypothetical protein
MSFGSEEGVEDAVYAFPVDAGSGIPHCYPYADRLCLGLYVHLPSAVCDGTHRFDSVGDQIPKDQLQLHSIA